MQDDTGQKYLEFHQKAARRPRQAIARGLSPSPRKVGLDMDRLERIASPEAKGDDRRESEAWRHDCITGHTTYVIGSEVVTGAVGLDELREKIKAAHSQSNG